jgi:hypothetical protein
LAISDITSNGEVQILFSEEMYSLKDFEASGMTFQLFQRLRRQVMKVNYNKGSEEEEEDEGRRRLEAKTEVKLGDGSVSSQKSALIDWKIVEFGNLHFTLKLIFSNPLYVSATPAKELVDIQMLK